MSTEIMFKVKYTEQAQIHVKQYTQTFVTCKLSCFSGFIQIYISHFFRQIPISYIYSYTKNIYGHFEQILSSHTYYMGHGTRTSAWSHVVTDLLLFVMVDDVLISRTALGKRVQLIHVQHVTPQVPQVCRDLEVHEIFTCR